MRTIGTLRQQSQSFSLSSLSSLCFNSVEYQTIRSWLPLIVFHNIHDFSQITNDMKTIVDPFQIE
jgi:hypothetical protein